MEVNGQFHVSSVCIVYEVSTPDEYQSHFRRSCEEKVLNGLSENRIQAMYFEAGHFID
jgi:hypothetical protein